VLYAFCGTDYKWKNVTAGTDKPVGLTLSAENFRSNPIPLEAL